MKCCICGAKLEQTCHRGKNGEIYYILGCFRCGNYVVLHEKDLKSGVDPETQLQNFYRRVYCKRNRSKTY